MHWGIFSARSMHDEIPWIQRFKQIVECYSENVAICNPDNEGYTYSELNNRSTQIACFLKHIRKDGRDWTKQVIGVCMSEVNIEVAAVFIAVWKLGAGVHLIEPLLKREVNKKRLNWVEPDIILVDEENKDLVEFFEAFDTILLEKAKYEAYQSDFSHCPEVNPQNIACVVCSSGTTGKPKVIKLPMTPFSNITKSAKEDLHISSNCKVLQLARRNFDAPIADFVMALGNGACIVLIDETRKRLWDDFVLFTNEQHITHMLITPSHMNGLLEQKTGTGPGPCFDTVMVVGEDFTVDLVKRMVSSTQVKRVVNGYGPSEAGIWVMSAVLYDKCLSNEISPIKLVKPVCGVDVRVMIDDEKGQKRLCKIGEQGELFISNRIRNVYKDKQLNLKRYSYIQDPASPTRSTNSTHSWFYRTGDIFNVKSDHLQFGGRQDNQIKINGQLVSTDEVRNELIATSRHLHKKRHINFQIGVVKGGGFNDSLIAYHTANSQEDANTIACSLRDHLVTRLAAYKLPRRYKWVSSFPYKMNGKIDIKQIEKQAIDSTIKARKKTLPKSDFAKKIAETWYEILGRPNEIFLESSFTDLGGTSLQLIVMVKKVNKKFECNVKVSSLLALDTLQEVLNQVRASVKDNITVSESSKTSHLVRLFQSASKDNLFLIPPHNVPIQVFQRLTRILTQSFNCNIFAVRAHGTEEGEVVDNESSITKLAQRYAELITNEHFHGNVHILGYCAGSLVAIEIARTLEIKGRMVSLLALVDAPNPMQLHKLETFFNTVYQGRNVRVVDWLERHQYPMESFRQLFEQAVSVGEVKKTDLEVLQNALRGARSRLDEDQLLLEYFKSAHELEIPKAKLEKLSSKQEKISYIVEQGRKLGKLDGFMDTGYFDHFFKMERLTAEATVRYVPKPIKIGGDILYFVASPTIERPQAWYPNPALWKDHLSNMKVERLTGDHYTIMQEDKHMQNLAECLQPFIMRSKANQDRKSVQSKKRKSNEVVDEPYAEVKRRKSQLTYGKVEKNFTISGTHSKSTPKREEGKTMI